MSGHYVGAIGELGRAAASQGDLECLRIACAGLTRFVDDINSSSLGDLQKDWIFLRLGYLFRELVGSGARMRRNDPAGPSWLLTPFNYVYLDSFARSGKGYGREMITQAAGALIDLAGLGALPRHELNEFGSFARGCVQRINEPFSRDALIFSVRVFGRLREILELATDPLSTGAYLETREQLASLTEWFRSAGKTDSEVEALIAVELGRFQKYERLREARTARSVRWPDPGSKE